MTVKMELNDPLHVRIDTENWAYLNKVKEHFRYYVDGYKFMDKYKSGQWDGKIGLMDSLKRTIPYGLLLELIKYHKREWSDVPYTISPEVKSLFVGIKPEYKKDLKFTPYDYQDDCISACLKTSKGIIRSATACHAKGDKVLMHDGFYKKIEDIRVGEYVIGKDGNPKKVLRLYKGEDGLYKIIPKNNRKPITVTGNHLLHLGFTNRGGKYKKKYNTGTINNISVVDYMSQSKWYKHLSKLVYLDTEACFTQETIDCNLTPYFIGLYLGDGCDYSCAVTNEDEECIGYIKEESLSLNMKVRSDGIQHKMIGSIHKRNIVYREFDKIGIHFKWNGGLKCGDRFIPNILFRQPVEYRKELLAGLIDLDGSLTNETYYEFTSKSKQLRDDVERLSISLGLACSVSDRLINNCIYYRVRIMGNISKIPVKIERKKPTRTSNTNAYRSGFTVEFLGDGEFYGIQVEDSLYVTESGMITHNSGKSLMISYVVKALQEQNMINNGIIVVPSIGLVTQFYEDMEEYGIDMSLVGRVGDKWKEWDNPLVISTWQSLNNVRHQMERMDCVIIDEVHGVRGQILRELLQECPSAKWRFGFTGTMPPHNTLDYIQIQSYIGPILKEYGASRLAKMGYVAEAFIKMVHVEYKVPPKGDYNDVKDIVFNNPYRQGVIKDIIKNSDGNILILVGKVKDEGDLLKNILSEDENFSDYEIEFLSGRDSAVDREKWRKSMDEKDRKIILIATFQIFQQGINIRSLRHLILASPFKSKVRVLQSIGRTLRLHADKTTGATVWDICDNAKHLVKHSDIRLKHYNIEEFDVTEYDIREGLPYKETLFG